MTFSNILVGLDLGFRGDELTPGSELALAAATRLAGLYGARLVLFHSTARDEHWDTEHGGLVYRDHDPASPERGPLESVLESVRREGIDAEVEVSPEKTWLAIVRRALEGEIDLVVVGKRSHSTAHTRRLGSVCAKLLRKCPCPVLAVKDGVAFDLRNIVAATDLLEAGVRSAQLAVELARDCGGEAHIVHAFQIPLDVQMEGHSEEYVLERRPKLIAQIMDQLDASPDDLACVTCHVGALSPTQAVMAAVNRYRADLVVMGSIARGGVPGLLVGNTAERLLGLLDCALMVIKPEGFICPVEALPGR